MAAGEILADGPAREVIAQKELLAQSDVVVPPIVELSLALWPTALPVLTVEALGDALLHPTMS